MTTGEGGMIVTNDPKLAERMRFLKDHAMDHDRRYYHPEIGFNYRMTNVQAAIGMGQLEHLQEALDNKRKIAQQYNESLKDIKGITLPPEKDGVKNMYWMYCILIEDDFGMTRDGVMEKLQEKGIGTRPFFISMHELPPYKDDSSKFKISGELANKGMNLPSSAHLTSGEIQKVCDVIKELAK
jgi:perosamine synthetase